MKIDEALKLQEELLGMLPEVGFNKYIASSKLGIEALKRLMDWRKIMQPFATKKLPGETEE